MDRRKFITGAIGAGVSGVGLSGCSTYTANEQVPNQKDIISLPERKQWLQPFACNIEQWFRPMPFLDRINAAKEVGFTAIEIWNPHQKIRGKTPESIARRAEEQNMLITSYSPNAPQFSDPNNESKFMEWLEVAIAAGKTLNVRNFNVTGHKLVSGLTEAQMIVNYTKMLKWAAPRLEAENMVATIEPYNPSSHKGHFVYGNEPALTICREINSPSVKINWDFFHMQRTNGNLITNLENGFDQVGYIQFADSPGRNQPGTGEVAYGNVLTKLRELGYEGYIGAEFFPKNRDTLTAASDLAKLSKSIALTPSKIDFHRL